MNLYLRRLVRISLASSLLLAALFPACSKRGVGERCDSTYAGDDDCEDGLVCTAADQLGGGADRCCPPESGSGNCLRRSSGTGGTSGTGGDGGSAGDDGSAGTSGGAGNGGSAGSDAGDGSLDDGADSSSDGSAGAAGAAGNGGSAGQLDEAGTD